MVCGDAATVRASACRVRAGPLHHHSEVHPGDDPGQRGWGDEVSPEDSRHTLELAGLVYVVTAREVGAVDDFNIAPGAQIRTSAPIPGYPGQHLGPVPPRYHYRVAPPFTEICSRK